MTLSFKTKINGIPNFFIEKIWLGLIQYQLSDYSTCNKFQKAHIEKFMQLWDFDPEANLIKRPFPKLHTIREDSKDIWKLGTQIHFIVNNRSKKRFQFAPILPVVSVQKILICSQDFNGTRINYVIVGDEMLSSDDVERLALNDGFNNVKDFFAFFSNNYQKITDSKNFNAIKSKWEFQGKIIHWTNLKY